MDSDTGSAIGGIIGMLFGLVIGLGVYLFLCYCLKTIVEKCGKDPGILIWIPILQLLPLFEVAGWETWKIVLFFIPIVSLIFAVLLWIEILKARGKPPIMVILLFIPCANIFFIPWLAFSQ